MTPCRLSRVLAYTVNEAATALLVIEYQTASTTSLGE